MSSSADPPVFVFRTVGPELFHALRAAHPTRLVLQVPAGLVRNAHELADRIRTESGAVVILATRPCFGACDFPSSDEAPRADVAVVLGHAPIPNVRLPRPTYFVEMREPGGDPEALAEIVRTAGLPHRLGLVRVGTAPRPRPLAPIRARDPGLRR